MPFVVVHDVNLSGLRYYRGLKDSELVTFKGKGHDFGLFMAESKNVIERALNAGMKPLSLLVEEKWAAASSELMDRLAHDYPEAVLYQASHEQFQQITGYEVTRGALACFARPEPRCAAELVKDAQRVAVLEDITNATNVGAIFRSAAALGVDAVLLSGSCHDPLYRRAARVSMGTVFQIPWVHTGDTKKGALPAVELLRQEGFKVCALALKDNALALGSAEWLRSDKMALVLGTEGEGLRAETIEACDHTVIIPMAHGVDSLNVAAASAVAFWELCKR